MLSTRVVVSLCYRSRAVSEQKYIDNTGNVIVTTDGGYRLGVGVASAGWAIVLLSAYSDLPLLYACGAVQIFEDGSDSAALAALEVGMAAFFRFVTGHRSRIPHSFVSLAHIEMMSFMQAFSGLAS